jgi:toxin ParE1/3/4
MKLVFSAEAVSDLERIGDWIARENPVRALSFVQELRQTCFGLVDFPERNQFVPRYEAQNIRRMIHGNYLIFYCVTKDRIEVIHILHGAQNYEAILSP